jgi:hypothetical protein
LREKKKKKQAGKNALESILGMRTRGGATFKEGNGGTAREISMVS